MAKAFSQVRRKPRVRTVNDQESMTVQSDRNRADIKEILRRYQATGGLVDMRQVDLEYRDVGEFEDFADLMLQSKTAELEFMKLPSKVREVFNHDVAEWLDAAHDGFDQDQEAKLRQLGVLEEVAKPAGPVEVRIVGDSQQNRNPDGTFASGEQPVGDAPAK